MKVTRPPLKQAGLTLIEAIAFLGILALVVVGALSLYGTASSSQSSTAHISELQALKTATQQLWAGQGGYGSVSLNDTLIAAKRVPTSLPVSGSTITNAWSGAVTVTGVTSTFTVDTTLVPKDVCVTLMTAGGSGWKSVKVGAGTVRTPPVAPATAASDCSGATNTLTFTAS